VDAEKELIEAMARQVKEGIEEEITRDLLGPSDGVPIPISEERPLTGTEKFL